MQLDPQSADSRFNRAMLRLRQPRLLFPDGTNRGGSDKEASEVRGGGHLQFL